MSFNSPFLIVYIGTSLFSVFLPLRFGYERIWGRWVCNNDEEVAILPWKNDGMISLPRNEEDGFHQEGDSLTNVHSTNGGYDDIDHQDDYSFDPTNAIDMQNNEFDPTQTNTTQSTNHYEPNNIDNDTYLYSHQDHIKMAIKVAPLWFTSNYFYAISLEWTSIASSTVLASMGSLFAFGFATCSSFGDERITKAKLMGVLLCFMGGVATAYTDVSKDNTPNGVGRFMRHSPHTAIDNPSSLWGDLAGLLSAIGYGAYTVLLRHLCPKDEKRMSMQLFFGYVGLLNMMALLPIALWVVLSQNDDSASDNLDNSESNSPYQNDDSTSTQTTITWSIFLFLILKGLLDNVLSDYLWARAVILTSATVASVSVGLTIPMAFFADLVMGHEDAHSTGQIVGAILVLCGFVFVNVDGVGEKGNVANDDVEDGEIEFENSEFVDERVHDVDIVL
jgi:solute carrier family 35 protein F5